MTEYSCTPETGVSLYIRFGFRTIWVIESIPDGERKTGKELFDDVLHYLNMQDPGLYVDFIAAKDRVEFFAALDRVTDVLRTTGQVPLLHFETHGNKQGLGLASGEFVTFQDLFPALREINVLCQNNLFITVAACLGGYLAQIIKPMDRAPFLAILGPSKKLWPDEVVLAYQAFYTVAAKRGELNSALAALRGAVPDRAESFAIWSSEHLFLMAFRHYFAEYCLGTAAEGRVGELLAKVHQARDLDPIQWGMVEAFLRKRISSDEGMRQDYESFRRTFFMHDLYPHANHLPNPPFEVMMQVALRSDRTRTSPKNEHGKENAE